jgi:hypothetical protein
LASCSNEIVVKNTPIDVFNTFWTTLNERYIYFAEKNVNWDSIYNRYSPRITSETTDEELTGIFQEIINALKDGHVGIIKSYQQSITYEKTSAINIFHPLMPDNLKYGFNSQPSYNYNCLIYQHQKKKYIYVYYSSFEAELSLEQYLPYLQYQDGIIIDIRNNGGGSALYCANLAALFYSGKRSLFYEMTKNNKGHDDFNSPKAVTYVGKGAVSSSTPIIILTSRNTYSAANFFTFMMADLPNCIIIGEQTGGGGSPYKSEYLPNGWILYYPNAKCVSTKGVNMELGFTPKYNISFLSADDSIQTIKALSLLDSIKASKK